MPEVARRGRRVLAIVLAVAAVGFLSSCTAARHPTPHASAATPNVVGATNVPTAVPNDPELRKDVALTSCEVAEGGWQAGGEVVNHSSTATKYRIEVFFTSADTTVLGTGAITLRVDAGASKAWKVDDRFTPAQPTICVATGVS